MADEILNIDITADAKAAVKEIDGVQKKVDALEKEKPEVTIGADDNASKPIDAVQKKVDKLDGETATADIKANVKDDDLDTFAQKLSKLSSTDQIVLLSLKAGAAQNELTQLATDIAQLDAADPDIDVKIARFDEVSGDLDHIKSQITAIADADPNAKAHLEEASKKLHNMGEESGKAGDAVHSMAGNAIGDFAATAAGVGPLGEAIGQLTEGALGGEIALKDMGKAALGVGVIAAGVLALNSVMSAFQAQAKKTAEIKAFNADNAKDFVKWATEGKNVLNEVVTKAAQADKIEVAPNAKEQTTALLLMAKEGENLYDVVQRINKSGKDFDMHKMDEGLEDISNLLLSANSNAKEFYTAASDPSAFNAFVTKIKSSNLSLADQGALLSALVYQQDQFDSGADSIAKHQALFGTAVDDTNKSLAASQTRFGSAATALQTWADKTAKALTGMGAFADALKGQDWGKASLDGAVTAMSEFTAQHNGLVDIAANSEEAFDNLSASVKENGKTFDVTTEKGRANQSALEDVAHALDTKLAAAYDDANGDMDTFKSKAATIATETLTRLQKELGLSDEQTADLAKSLGLLPEDIETRYKLAGDEEAKLKIGLLQTAIDNLPPDVQTTVTQQIIAGDYQGAVATVQNYYNQHPPDMPTDAKPPSTFDLAAVGAAAGAYFANHPVEIPTKVHAGSTKIFAKGGKVGREGGIGGEDGPEIIELPDGRTVIINGPTPLAPGTKVTSTRKTRQILQRRQPKRYANGTGSPATIPVASGSMTFQFIQQAPIYGVSDLDRHLNAWSQRLAQQISAGKR